MSKEWWSAELFRTMYIFVIVFPIIHLFVSSVDLVNNFSCMNKLF